MRMNQRVARVHLQMPILVLRAAEVHRVRADCSPGSLLHSQVVRSEEVLAHCHISGVRVQHLCPHPHQHAYSRHDSTYTSTLIQSSRLRI